MFSYYGMYSLVIKCVARTHARWQAQSRPRMCKTRCRYTRTYMYLCIYTYIWVYEWGVGLRVYGLRVEGWGFRHKGDKRDYLTLTHFELALCSQTLPYESSMSEVMCGCVGVLVCACLNACVCVCVHLLERVCMRMLRSYVYMCQVDVVSKWRCEWGWSHISILGLF